MPIHFESDICPNFENSITVQLQNLVKGNRGKPKKQQFQKIPNSFFLKNRSFDK